MQPEGSRSLPYVTFRQLSTVGSAYESMTVHRSIAMCIQRQEEDHNGDVGGEENLEQREFCEMATLFLEEI